MSTDIGACSVNVDAQSNQIRASCTASTPVQLVVRVQSVHPSTPFTYGGGFGFSPGSGVSDLGPVDAQQTAGPSFRRDEERDEEQEEVTDRR